MVTHIQKSLHLLKGEAGRWRGILAAPYEMQRVGQPTVISRATYTPKT